MEIAWHCEQVLCHNNSSETATRSATHCAGDSDRLTGPFARPVKFLRGSSTSCSSAPCVAMYPENFFTKYAWTTFGLSWGTPSSKRLSNVSKWHPAHAFANFGGAISSRPELGRRGRRLTRLLQTVEATPMNIGTAATSECGESVNRAVESCESEYAQI